MVWPNPDTNEWTTLEMMELTPDGIVHTHYAPKRDA